MTHCVPLFAQYQRSTQFAYLTSEDTQRLPRATRRREMFRYRRGKDTVLPVASGGHWRCARDEQLRRNKWIATRHALVARNGITFCARAQWANVKLDSECALLSLVARASLSFTLSPSRRIAGATAKPQPRLAFVVVPMGGDMAGYFLPVRVTERKAEPLRSPGQGTRTGRSERRLRQFEPEACAVETVWPLLTVL